ncbi:MAG: NBR1-Ig-like domain-containing protein, partial [Anaerolineales bacterium]
MRRRIPIQFPFLALLLFALILSGCNYPGTATPDLFPTYAAQTVEARLTQSAGTTPVLPPPTNTEAPPPPPTEVPATPTNTSTPIATQTQTPCNRAAFVSDVTVPDGTTFAPNATFTKTWRLKNAGTCTWNSSYSIVFDDGNSMNGPASKALTGTVAPGQTVDISVDLKAPSSSGSYRGYWMLRSDAGILFGVGSAGDVAFWVDIQVGSGGDTVVYNFISRYCDATWVSGAGTLPCPGNTGDSEGFVIKVNNPKLETGATDDEP